MKRTIAAVLAAAILAGPAQAQLFGDLPVAGPDPVVEGLVVTPPAPGLAWWRVVDEDSIVYILIVPHTSPSDLGWDPSTVDFRLTGANKLITPYDFSLVNPKSIVGMGSMLAQAPGAMIKMRKAVPKKSKGKIIPLEQRLSPEVRDRFVAMRQQIGQPAERYAEMTPMQAAGRLEGDYSRYLKLRTGDDEGGPLQKHIEQLARSKKVRNEAAWKMTIPAVKLNIEIIPETTGPKAEQCLSKSLDQMVVRGRSEISAAQAWARGDVRPLLRPARFENDPGCHNAMGMASPPAGVVNKMEEDYVRSQVEAIERAMKKPGHTVAILEALSPVGSAQMGLLGTKGVLARLKAKGYEIRTPGNLAD